MRVNGFHNSYGSEVLVSIGVVWSFVNMYIVFNFILSAKSRLMILLLEWTRDITALLSAQYSRERELHWVLLNTRENIVAWSELRSIVYKKTIVEIYRVEVLLIGLTFLAVVLLMFLTTVLLYPSLAGWIMGLLVLTPASSKQVHSEWLNEEEIFYAV